MKRVFTLILVFLLVLAVTSCGEKKKDVVKERVEQEISAEDGGTVSTSDDSVTIDIPADALDSNTKITMTVYESSHHSTKKGETKVSKVVECEPSGTIFKKPVIIKMKTDKNIKNQVVAAAVYNEAKGEWSYSGHGAYAVLTGKDEAGDPVMTSAAGDPVMLNAAGDPIMMNAAGDPIMMSAAGDPIMLASAGDPIMSNAAGDPIMNAAAGDPIMMTTGHFTAYTFIALDSESDGTASNDTDADASDDTDAADSDDEDTDNDADADEPVYVPECGNGIVDEGEECDNGADNGTMFCDYGEESCELCSLSCESIQGNTSYCGDGLIDTLNGETCDDGVILNGTYAHCNATCSGPASYCGDGHVDEEEGETCDDGADNDTYGHCNAWCDGPAPYCGDGYVDEEDGETCDDGTALNGTYGHCNATCNGRSPYCGDGNTDTANGETCDNGSANGITDCIYGETACTVCTYECTEEAGAVSYCGDSYVDEDHGEACDHGADNGRTNCNYGEESCDLCTTQCQPVQGTTSYCGDGMIDAANEETCDDGATLNGAYGHCNAWCDGPAAYCGDGYVDDEDGETCDDGVNNGTYGHCNATCNGRAPYCGDGNTDTENGEECDNGTANGTTDCAYGETACTVCTYECTEEAGAVSYCGDSYVDEDHGEACDHGADNGRTNCNYGEESCDLCTTQCQPVQGTTSYCGDGIIDAENEETCDDGATLNGTYGHCNGSCNGRAPYCGDGYVDEDEGETCDDGADNGTYGHCNATCNGRSPYCGDGNIDTENGEECDNGTANGTTDCAYGETACTVCTYECTEEAGAVSYCGDSYVDEDHGEACDHGADNGRTNCNYGEESCDLCTTQCQPVQGTTSYCGDGIIDAENEETCDEGKTLNGTYGHCNGSCNDMSAYCGDGYVDEDEGETCDDGTDNGTYSHCNATCNGQSASCGDGNVDTEQGEACDDGNTEDGDYCSADCQSITGSCGDGIIQDNEACDKAEKGNDAIIGNGEGTGAYCSSDCSQIIGSCGDGIIQREDCTDYGEDCVEVAGLNEGCDNGEDNSEETNCEYGEESCSICSTECQPVQTATSYCGDGRVDVENEEACDKADPSVGNGEGIGSRCSDDCTEIMKIAKVLCTGQTKCFNDDRIVIDCPEEGGDFYGQDANYAARQSCTPQAYEKIEEGDVNIVDDLVTGLRWYISPNGGTWNNAVAFCDSIDTEDGREWRLPTAKELMSIIDSGSSYPAVRDAYFRSVFSSYNSYWSATYFLNSKTGEDEVLIMDIGYGHLKYDSYGKEEGNNNFACVSGEEYGVAGTFTTQNISGGSVVTDSATDLMWTAATQNDLSWQRALTYCENLNYAGYTDWRLPNRNEFATILDYSSFTSKSSFPNINAINYWTSTSAVTYGGSSGAFIIDVAGGTMVAVGETGVTSAAVLCVRNDDIAEYQDVPACDETGYTPCADANTGIVWSRDMAYADEMSYIDAAQICREMTQAGISQWRLPTIDEIRTILASDVLGTGGTCHVTDECYMISSEDCYDSEICETGTAIESAFHDYTFMVSGTMTGEWEGEQTLSSWKVNFGSGAIESHEGEYIYVTPSLRCVKDESIPAPEFPYTDEVHGLVWSSLSKESFTFNEARGYCTTDEQHAWRLPTIEELETLAKNCHDGNCAPDIAGGYSVFGDVSILWSSTVTGNQTPTYVENYYNVLDFMTASQIELVEDEIQSYKAKVRCVSSVQQSQADLCDPNPCIGIANSDGACSTGFDGGYSCGCNDGYFWNGEECVSPCDSNPCTDVWNTATDECFAESATEYMCDCDGDYFWDGYSCTNPCEGDPCSSYENSLGNCSVLSATEFECDCDGGNWMGMTAGCSPVE